MRLRHESSLFKDLTLHDAEERLQIELAEISNKIKSDYSVEKEAFRKEMEAFQSLFKRYLYDTDCEIDWNKIESLPTDLIQCYDNLRDYSHDVNVNSYLEKLVVVKLNGGLGTSMGCNGPKSVIQVRDNLTFLDLTIQQIENLNDHYACDIPLVLMNSFNTFEDTNKVIKKYEKINVHISSFLQSTYPRLNRESLLPLTDQPYKSFNGKTSATDDNLPRSNEAWYPPGHGDFYRSFVNSGLAEKYLKEGKEWVFLSNIDNLGAEVDIKILKYLIDSNSNDKKMHFLMEVTDKTRADIKGGTLIKYGDSLRLLEIAQVPKERVDDFVSVRKFKIFNTNNLWINLRAMIQIVNEGKMQLEIIKNPKTLDDGTNIIQLEEAAGAAIKNFKGGAGLNVPRSRFLPVKTTSDLLLVMSNLYELHRGSLHMSEKRNFQNVPLVKLGKDFKKVKDFLIRFESIPDLIELDQLTVSGDVYFGKGLQLKGSVIVIANPGEFINLPSGSCLENKIVSGNLRILDH